MSGYNVTDVINYNERLLQKYFIENMRSCPEVIALASSRIMQLNSAFLKEDKFTNSGVSGASLKDVIAIHYLFEKKKCDIKKIIIGIDPWILYDNHNQTRWQGLRNEYSFFLNNSIKQVLNLSTETKAYEYLKYKELVSRFYFKSSLQFIVNESDKSYFPTKSPINKGFTRLVDGSIFYDEVYRIVSPNDIEKRALKDTEANPVYKLGDFTTFSENYKIIFTKFIEYIQKKDIQVGFFLISISPNSLRFFYEKSILPYSF